MGAGQLTVCGGGPPRRTRASAPASLPAARRGMQSGQTGRMQPTTSMRQRVAVPQSAHALPGGRGRTMRHLAYLLRRLLSRGEPALEDPPDARVGAADLIPLPGGQSAGVKPEPAGKLPLGESRGFPRGPDPPAKGRGRRPGVVAKEAEDRRQEAQLRLGMALLPIREARLGAADLSGGLLLPETAIKASLAEVVAEGAGFLGIAGSGFPSSEVDTKTYA
jgi:hypothetical protein